MVDALSTRCMSKPYMPPTRAGSSLQRFFSFSKTIFRLNSRPSESQIAQALTLMAKIPLTELGMDKRKNQKRSPLSGIIGRDYIEYLPVYECADFDIGIFCLPSGTAIPLHDHPDMTVMSRLLYGKMLVRSLDRPTQRGIELASKIRDEFVMDGDVNLSHLNPESGNLHMFKALTSCAVLDVLTPPYSPADGRDCTYYRILDSKENFEDKEGMLLKDVVAQKTELKLEPCSPPDEFVVRRGIYTGVKPKP